MIPMLRGLAFGATLFLSALPATAELDITEITTPGGLTAWLVQEPSIPFVALEIDFRGGTSLDAPDKRGAVNLMTALLEEGAGPLDAQAFARARDDLAMSLSFASDDDGVSLSARFLSETREPAADLMRRVLTEPRFDAAAIERVRSQVLSNIRSDAEDPDAIAGRTMSAALFGDHPYGTPGEGTEDSVAALTRDDLVAAHAGALARDRLYIAAAGDITPDQLAALLDRVLGDLPETGAALPGPVTPAFWGGVEHVPYPTPQATIRFVQPGIAQDDPDYFAAYLLSQVLGAGGFQSRLMTEIREKRGLTYGVAAYLQSKDRADLLAGGMATANATVAESIALIRAEWEKLRDDGVTPEELDAAKTYLTGAYPLRFDGNGRIASILVGMQRMGLEPDYVATRNDRVNAVTLDEVNRLAATLIDPEALSFVVVGQPQDPAN